jgi:hypothetical protein
MFFQPLRLAGVQSPLWLIAFDLFLAVDTGRPASQILSQQRRRRQRQHAVMAHYSRSMEDFPELATR